VGGDPVSFVDPTGQCPICAAIAIDIAIGAGAGAVTDIIIQFDRNGGHFGCIDWGEAGLAAAGGGAVAGGLTGLLRGLVPLLRGATEGAARAAAEEGIGGAAGEATGFLGRAGNELENAPYQGLRNEATQINGRDFSGHALDRMQGRGIMPSVVENTISTGTQYQTGAGTIGFYDPINNVRVILNSGTGRVVTVIRGAP
jgi:hypothetical protein